MAFILSNLVSPSPAKNLFTDIKIVLGVCLYVELFWNSYTGITLCVNTHNPE